MPAPDGPQFRRAEAYNYPARTVRRPNDPQNVNYLIGKSSSTIYTYGEGDELAAISEVSNRGATHEVGYPLRSHDSTWAKEHAEKSGQVPLFTMEEKRPAGAKVESLYSTKGSRVPAMKLLGIADVDSRRQTGIGLDASNDLSKYSNRIVDKLASRGQIAKPEEVHSNNEEFLSGPEPLRDWGVDPEYTEPVSEEDQRMGSARLRSAVRRPKKKTPPNTEQLRMDI